MKTREYFLIFLFAIILQNIFAEWKWRCVSTDMENAPQYSWYNIPVYDPVRDDIAMVDDGWIERFKDNKWTYKHASPKPLWYPTVYPLFHEPHGTIIPFGIFSDMYYPYYYYYYEIQNYRTVSQSIHINSAICDDLFRYPNYPAVNIEPGKFIICLGDDDVTGAVPYHRCFFFDTYDHTISEAPWDGDDIPCPMFLDERRKVVVKQSDYGDVTEWDGTTWTLRSDIIGWPPYPIADNYVYDEARGVIVINGGAEYDGESLKIFLSINQPPIFINYDSDYEYLNIPIVYESAHNRFTMFVVGRDTEWCLPWDPPYPDRNEIWRLEDDATTQTYSRRNVMQEGCEMRTWGETGVDCAFTSSTKWSRIIMVKTEDKTAPDFARDHPTSGILAATMIWEIKTDRPPEQIPAQTTGTLVSISYPPELLERLTRSTDTLRLCVARPNEPIGVPIADTVNNSDRAFYPWRILPQIDHTPLPGEYGVYNDITGSRFLFRTTMQEPFQGSPAGAPRTDGKPKSLCYTIITTAPDARAIIKDVLLGGRKPTPKERLLLDQNSDNRIDVADLIILTG